MRWQDLTSRDHRRLDGDWLPIVGDVVCVHAGSNAAYNYLARVLTVSTVTHGRYATQFRVLPLYAPRTNDREVSPAMIEPALLTFQGYRCVRCKKGNIR